ncbi:hypothetical protein, partial [Roseateles koreensis]
PLQNSQKSISIGYLPGSSDHRHSPQITSVHAGWRGIAGQTNQTHQIQDLAVAPRPSFNLTINIDLAKVQRSQHCPPMVFDTSMGAFKNERANRSEGANTARGHAGE